MTRPFASIVIPSRNRAAALRECVAACLHQDYPADRFEVIVIDDGSEPPLESWLDDSRVRIIRQNHAGPAVARNRGIESARGPLLAFTDDDCRPKPDWLAKIADAWVASPGALIGGLTLNGLPSNSYAATSQFLIDYLYDYFERINPKQRFFTSNNLGGSRDCLKAHSGFDPNFPLPAAEDRDLCDRWREKGGALLYIPGAMVDHYHRMSLRGFLRQQFNYGRGAKVLRARRSARGAVYPVEPRGFYIRLFIVPFHRARLFTATRIAALLFLAQVSNLLGFFYQRKT